MPDIDLLAPLRAREHDAWTQRPKTRPTAVQKDPDGWERSTYESKPMPTRTWRVLIDADTYVELVGGTLRVTASGDLVLIDEQGRLSGGVASGRWISWQRVGNEPAETPSGD